MNQGIHNSKYFVILGRLLKACFKPCTDPENFSGGGDPTVIWDWPGGGSMAYFC